MSSKILTYTDHPELQPNHGLAALYHPENAPYRFQAKTVAEAAAWQERTRQKLHEKIGFSELPKSANEINLIEEVDKGDYIRQKWLLRTWEHALLPFYLLIPNNMKPPYIPVLAFHGHGYGVKDIVGLWENGDERDTPDGYHKDFAVALCRQGFLVAAPEISCFGERCTNFNDIGGFQDWQTCAYTARFASFFGGTALGLRIHDAFSLTNYLASRSDINIDRLGTMGISGGGMHAFFYSALDPRIRAAVISGYYCNFRASIYGMNHCECNYIPGLAEFGEIYDLVGLIAPRAMLVESGDHDDIFPRPAVEDAVEKGRNNVYAVWDKKDHLEIDYFVGRHQISGNKAYDFLRKHLKVPVK